MASEEIVDPTIRNETSVRRVLLHLMLPFCLTLLAVVAIAWVGYTSYRTTQAGVSQLTDNLLDAVQRNIGQEVADYIMPAVTGNQVASGMIAHAPVQVQDRVFYAYASTVLREAPQLQSFYLATEQGDFLLVTRSPDKGILDRIRLSGTGTARVFHHELYDEHDTRVKVWDEDAKGYDPRTRPWFTDTAGTSSIKWTQPFLFPSDGQFVMTSSVRFKGGDGHTLVFAANISLNELSAYLEKIQIGNSGSAMIVDGKGRIMAGRNLSQQAKAAGWNPDRMVINPKDEPVFSLGYDHYRVRGFGPHNVTTGGRHYITMASALPRYSEGWILLIAVPEKDFASFGHQSSRQSLLFMGIIIVFSLLLGGLFIRQVRRTERVTRQMAAQQLQITHESAAVRQVAIAPQLFDPSVEPLVLTTQLARVAQARRVSLWRFLHDGAAMVCEESYDLAQDIHTGGFEMGGAELNRFFAAIGEGAPFTVNTAAADERTASFERLVMREIGTRTLAVFPVSGSQGVLGMIALEDPTLLPHLQYFMDLTTNIAGTRFMAQRALEQHTEQAPVARLPDQAVPPALAPVLTDNMLMHGPELENIQGASIYSSVAVLVITFSDPVVEGEQEVTALITLINQLAMDVQAIATEERLFAVEVAGHRMICMAGCTTAPDPGALTRLADAALRMRETFMAALAAADLEPVFTMGIDYGTAFGGAVGQSPKVFNLWGQTVSLAELMAEGASDPGVIQVTERVYAALRDRYLFRSRGAFFAPNLGLGRAYTLAARR
ncbi:MAG: cache domain-containing protein [Acetobacter sp.]|uniref:adenylate/guanylate cyclase domain-containing protein n=1 Tax=Acetobacter sp. TaxID=440 RepID=UPI0039EBF256